MKKIKILFAINDMGIGGAQNMLAEQLGAIDAEKFDPYLLTLYERSGSTFWHKIKLPEDHLFRFSFKNLRDYASWWKLYRTLQAERFDCVITNLFDANFAVRIAAFFAGVPVRIAYIHNMYSHFRRWQIVAEYLLAHITYRFLVGAPWVRDFSAKAFRIPAKKIQVIYDAAELTFEHASDKRGATLARLGLPEDAFYIVSVGRLDEQKGHTYLIEAFRELTQRFPEKKLFLLIYGQGTLKQTLEAQIAAAGLGERVRFMGIAPMEDILSVSDCFAMLSLWEGFSVALIQAMNAGCPIVATEVSGAVDALVNEASGLLVPPKRADLAANALERVIQDSSLRKKLGAGAQKASERFHIQHHIREIEALIESARLH